MFGELQKNALGVALAPLVVFFFWRGMEDGRKLDLILGGLIFGAVGLTHELVFGILIIVFLSHLAFLFAYRRRIPWKELKAVVVVAVPVGLVCGIFYAGSFGTISTMAGEREPAVPGELQAVAAFLGEPPEGPHFQERTISRFYDEYIGCPLFVLASLGAGVAVYRRRPADLFLLTWVMAALVMAQPWVIRDYQWRFSLMLATPVALLAAIGIVEGAGKALWKLGVFIRRPQVLRKCAANAGKLAALALLVAVVVHQTQVSNTYAWTGEMLQPTITTGQYLALVEFQQRFGEVYAFRAGFEIYWPDAVGLKSDIQGGDEISRLSHLLRVPGGDPAVRLTGEWHRVQENLGENVYVLASPGHPDTRVLENPELFTTVFERPALRVYALKEDTTLFQAPSGKTLAPEASEGLALQPPFEGNGSPFLKFALAPVYLLQGSARFIAGIPLTIFLWVFLGCLLWEVIRRLVGGDAELIRKILVLILVSVLVLASVVWVRGYWEHRELGPPPAEQPSPPGEHLELSEAAAEGVNLHASLGSEEMSGVSSSQPFLFTSSMSSQRAPPKPFT
jgi:hypothetical protein